METDVTIRICPHYWKSDVRSLTRIRTEFEKLVRIAGSGNVLDDLAALHEGDFFESRLGWPAPWLVYWIAPRRRGAIDERQKRCQRNKAFKHAVVEFLK